MFIFFFYFFSGEIRWRSWSHWRGRQISIRHAFLTIGGEDVNETIGGMAVDKKRDEKTGRTQPTKPRDI